MKKILLLYGFCSFALLSGFTQVKVGPAVHAHNDYEQKDPFFNAYNNRVASIEADVFAKDGKLFVAHEEADIRPVVTLEGLYLKPLQQMITRNHGNVFSGSATPLIFLIDFKTPGDTTMRQLLLHLEKYPLLTATKSLRIVISGDVPDTSRWSQYPPHVFFDGRPFIEYNRACLERVVMVSDSFHRYISKTDDNVSADTSKILLTINDVKQKGKMFRFWGTPDTKEMWEQLVRWKVDLISTDHVDELSHFLNAKKN